MLPFQGENLNSYILPRRHPSADGLYLGLFYNRLSVFKLLAWRLWSSPRGCSNTFKWAKGSVWLVGFILIPPTVFLGSIICQNADNSQHICNITDVSYRTEGSTIKDSITNGQNYGYDVNVNQEYVNTGKKNSDNTLVKVMNANCYGIMKTGCLHFLITVL